MNIISVLLATIHVVGLLTCFALLGTSRIGACIRFVALQGILFSLVPVIVHDDGLTLRVLLLAGANIALKGVIFPVVLLQLRTRAGFHREVEPFIGFIASILFGIVALVVSLGLARELQPALGHAPFVMLQAAIFLIATGLLLIVSRRNALIQIVGYLAIENGIFVFGAITVVATPLLVELGILLDAFVAVFVMGVAVLHISREFGMVDAGRLNTLRG